MRTDLPTDDPRLDALEGLDPSTIASALNRAAGEERRAAFRGLPPAKAGKVFGLLEPSSQADVLQALEPETRRAFLDEMEPDDRARLLGRLPEEEAERLLQVLTQEERALTMALLRYPEGSAGRIMTPEFVRLHPAMSVADALAAVRAGERRAETIYFMPVAAEDMRLLGTVDLAALVLADEASTIADLASTDVPAVQATDDQEEVARFMKEADLMVVPVVDEGNRLVGIITFDDAMEVLEFEEGEDFARTGASEPIQRPYLSVSILRLVRSRIVWLSVLAIAATLTVNVLGAFEDTLESVVALALFIPLLIGIGGNTGAQSATTIVRALAVRDVRPRDALKVALREVETGLLMGVAIAIAGYVIVSVFFDGAIALVVAITLVAICGLAALVGSLMPLLARKLSIDPAVFSAPFVTTIVDATGLLIYFMVARAVLGV
ncbi:magnesium transporter [Lutibaculum baratangense]|uniref:Magnesium transporter MgtE n=1 Tax=Lutibaculum baratangense AMV1 TaxID=631454 RepID=V4R017_9HYPH|nr:magnesium transporter [Lutibaculum baratangense]ESR25352.1 Mg/Co/Ni transporter MgtE [Lutibaculum baratangense AMV1]